MTADRTRIPGKDAALEDTIERASALLRSFGLSTELVSEKNPVAHCWSVHLRSIQCAQIYTNGKGGSRLASRASAILEFFERLSTNLFFADYYLGADSATNDFVFYPTEKWFPEQDLGGTALCSADGTQLLNKELRTFYTPGDELPEALLRDNNSDNEQRGIAALPFEHLGTGQEIYVPISILNNIYASNGMAAGNTPTECRAQALSEILERHVKNRVIAEGLCLPDVPQEVIGRSPRIQGSIEELRSQGFTLLIKDASLGGVFPVVCVLLLNPANGGCYASFGAHCRFEVALERTVTELLQGRSLDQLGDFQSPSHDLESVADVFNLESHFINSDGLLSWRMFRDEPDHGFHDWSFEGSTAEECDRLKVTINDLGFEIYCAEYLHCGTYTCRILVPGMSEVYSVDDLVWNNKSAGALLRPQILRLRQMSVDELRAFSADLRALGLNDQQPISDIIGVVFDEAAPWSSLRLGELRAMTALATGDFDDAADWYHWCHSFDASTDERQALAPVLHELLQFALSGEEPAAYHSALVQLFGDDRVHLAQRIIGGELTFHGLDFADTWEEISPAHCKLLGVYRILHGIKEAGSSP